MLINLLKEARLNAIGIDRHLLNDLHTISIGHCAKNI